MLHVFQHFNKVLGQRAVAYLNVDSLLEGTDLMRVKASPALHTMVLDASQKVNYFRIQIKLATYSFKVRHFQSCVHLSKRRNYVHSAILYDGPSKPEACWSGRG